MVKKKSENNKLAFIWESPRFHKLAQVSLIFVGILFVLSLARNIYTLRLSNERIVEAQSTLASIKQENEALQNQVEVVESEFYKEKLGRDKLGLAKSGETIAVLPPEEQLRDLAPKLETTQAEALPKPNWRRWLDLFVN